MKRSVAGVISIVPVAMEADIEEISGLWEEFKSSVSLFNKRSGIAPDLADSMVFEKVSDAREMPFSMREFNGEREVAWKLGDELAESQFVMAWKKGGGQLDEDAAES